MPDFEKMYYTLFNAITDAVNILSEAQQKTEEIYIVSSEREDEERTKKLNSFMIKD